MADDWDKVTVIRKSKPSSKDLKSAAVINKAMASGQVEIIKKEKHGENAAHLAKIENSDDVKVAHVEKSVAKAIQAARQKMGITQKELAAKICEKPTVVNEYESGKAIPSQQVLGKLERALNVKLRGSNIGAPLK